MPLPIHQPGRIEIKLNHASQLFHKLDPSPFRASELASDVEDYVVDCALELPSKSPIEIVVHLPADEFTRASASDMRSAIRNHFELRNRANSRELRELFKTGRLSLVAGLAVLSVCLFMSWLLIERTEEGPLIDILSEGFVIFGWVAIWKPSEIFLYAWFPIWRRGKLFRRISEADVAIVEDRRNTTTESIGSASCD